MTSSTPSASVRDAVVSVRGQIRGQLDRVDRAPVEIRRPVPGDPREPAAERTRIPERFEPMPGREEDVLNQIFNVGARRPSQEQTMNHADIALVEAAKRALVPAPRGSHEPRIFRGLPHRKHRQRHASVAGRISGNLHH